MTEREIVVYNQTAMYFERDSLETEMNQIEMLNNLRIGPWCVGGDDKRAFYTTVNFVRFIDEKIAIK